jgi:kumamolisin
MESTPSGRAVIPGSERLPLTNAVSSGPVDPAERASVTVVVRPRKPLPTIDARPERILTRDEYAREYGADPADMRAIEGFASAANLTVVASDAARRSVTVSGTLGDLSAAFGTSLETVTLDGKTFRTRSGSLSVPAEMREIVAGVFGLDERPQARTHFRRRTQRPAASADVSYTPPQVAAAYGFPTGVTGAGQTIAVIELGGGYVESDLATYFSSLGLAMPTVLSVSVDGASNAPTGSADGPDGEVMLDIEVAGSIANGATIVAYFAPNTDQGFLDAITTAIHDTTNAPSVVSISWGGPESTYTASALTNFDDALAAAAMLGVTVTVAAGDNGSSDGVTGSTANVDFPASSPHVLACGGTSLRASGTTITSETVWNDGTSGGATGGGVSDVFPVPTWQASAGVPPSVNAGAKTGRGVPDVAGDADPDTGYTTRVDGSDGVIGGTSAVAPLWAALVALANQKNNAKAGFINPALYAAGETPFRDIVSGNNGAYAARAGWDACTGLGSPIGTAIVTTIAPAG